MSIVYVHEHGTETDIEWWCDGCECRHAFRVKGEGRPMWTWNGDLLKPTFAPSLLYKWDEHVPKVTSENLHHWRAKPWIQTPVAKVCHVFVREGMVEYLPDCTHYLAGKTVPMTGLP